MPDTNNESPSSDTDSTTADVFALVGHEIRTEIIRVFGTLDRDEFIVPFGELRSRMDMDIDPSQLHYHLEQLVGHYIERTEDGYHMRPEGIRLYLTVLAGALDREQEELSLDPGFDCHTCQAPVKSSFNNGVVRVWCPECENKYGHDFLDIPLATFANDDTSFSFAHFCKYVVLKTFSLAQGVCPSCGNTLDPEIRSNEKLSPHFEVQISQPCDLCGARWLDPIGRVLLADSELVVFCSNHGVDVLSTPYWELEFASTDEHVTVRSTDPWEVALEVTLDGDTLELVVDGDVNVIERNRLGSSTDVSTDFLGDERSNAASTEPGEEIALPDEEDCAEDLPRYRWPDGVACPRCDSTDTIKQGTTRKGAQRYMCHDCDRSFNDLTGTIFAGRGLSLPEMFYIIRAMDETETAQIARQLDRSYKSVLAFVHEVQDASGGDSEVDLSAIREAEN